MRTTHATYIDRDLYKLILRMYIHQSNKYWCYFCPLQYRLRLFLSRTTASRMSSHVACAHYITAESLVIYKYMTIKTELGA